MVSPRGVGTSRASGRRTAAAGSPEGSATNGLEAKLWQAADALRNNMDAAEYKHIVLGLIFLKYISDAFEAKHAELTAAAARAKAPTRKTRTSTRPRASSGCRPAPAGAT